MLSFLPILLLPLALAAPAPQELVDETPEDPSVLVVGHVPLNFGDFGGLGRLPGFGRIPGFGQMPDLRQHFQGFQPSLPSSFGFGGSQPKISISLGDLFGRPHSPHSEAEADSEADSQVGGRVPGILNSLFDVLGTQLGLGGRQNTSLSSFPGAAQDTDYDHHNQTYHEKVLPDGSVVRVNRTVIHDTDEDGNSFFFSTSFHHVLGDGQEQEQEEDEADKNVEPSVTEEKEEDYRDDAELVPVDIDETENEIEGDIEGDKERKAKAEFPGIDATAPVVDELFE